MERSYQVSFPRGDRSSDVPSWTHSQHGISGYPSSLSLYSTEHGYDPDPLSRDSYGVNGNHISKHDNYSYSSSFDDVSRNVHAHRGGHPSSFNELSRDGYPHSSSFDNVSRRPYEDKKPSESYDKLGYGFELHRGSSLGDLHRGDGSSLRQYELSFTQHRTFQSQLTPALYRDDSQNKQDILLSQLSIDSHQSQLDLLGLNKSELAYAKNPLYEQSGASTDLSAGLRLPYPSRQANLPYAQSSNSYYMVANSSQNDYLRELEKHHDIHSSGTYAASGLMNRGGEAGYGSWLSNMQAADNIESSSRLTNAGVKLRDGKCFGGQNEGSARQACVTMPIAGEKGNSAGGSKVADSKGVQSGSSVKEVSEDKKRKSRWGPVEENEKDSAAKQKKKSRWSPEESSSKGIILPNFLKGMPIGGNLVPEIMALKMQLFIINRKLQSGQVLDDVPDAERSPSPEPIFDNCGYRVNTREFRARAKLSKERQNILIKLSEKNLSPLDIKSAKLFRKIYIPVDKYPDYNFIGLIIGPRGITQKKMEKESGTKIYIRGKGSVKAGSSAQVVNEENLHVVIEADNENAINKAASMVENLLVPVEDEQNELKKAQLRKLAMLNGSTELCHVCEEPGHAAKDCPFMSKVSDVILASGTSGSGAIRACSGLNKDIDNTHLYVANLPPSVDDTELHSLFSPFGKIVHARVMKSLITESSNSNGFVKYYDSADAAQAVALMNGYKLEGKVLLVKFESPLEVMN